MNVRLLIHLEPVSGHPTWWVESPDVSGFTGAADTLQDARLMSEHAIREILEERGESEVTFSYSFAPSAAGSAGDLMQTLAVPATQRPRNEAPLEVSRVA